MKYSRQTRDRIMLSLGTMIPPAASAKRKNAGNSQYICYCQRQSSQRRHSTYRGSTPPGQPIIVCMAFPFWCVAIAIAIAGRTATSTCQQWGNLVAHLRLIHSNKPPQRSHCSPDLSPSLSIISTARRVPIVTPAGHGCTRRVVVSLSRVLVGHVLRCHKSSQEPGIRPTGGSEALLSRREYCNLGYILQSQENNHDRRRLE